MLKYIVTAIMIMAMLASVSFAQDAETVSTDDALAPVSDDGFFGFGFGFPWGNTEATDTPDPEAEAEQDPLDPEAEATDDGSDSLFNGGFFGFGLPWGDTPTTDLPEQEAEADATASDPEAENEVETTEAPSPLLFAEKTFYFGAGLLGKDTSTTDGSRPLSTGLLLRRQAGSTLYFGVDASLEGTSLHTDCTQFRRPSQSYSVNAVVGGKVWDRDGHRVDVGVLLGVRETDRDSLRSVRFYECSQYIDARLDHEVNMGLLINYTLSERFTVGARITGESIQSTIGIKF